MDHARDEFARHCQELLAPLGSVRTRRMFGGHGLYLDDLFMALIFSERLYLKTDDTTRPRFQAAGCLPFIYESNAKPVSLSYFTAPDDAMESPALMQPWARLAFEAALRARAAKPPAAARKPRSTAPAKTARPRKASPKTNAGRF